MLNQQEILIFRSIKKSAVLLLILQRTGESVSAFDLGMLLDISIKTIKDRLGSLQALDLVRQIPESEEFVITDRAKDLLDFENSEKKIFSPSSITINKDSTIPQESIVLLGASQEKISPKRENKPKSPKIHEDDRAIKAAEKVPIARQEIITALKKAGIRDPVRSQLARMRHLTAKHVTRLEENLKREAGKRYTTGLLVYTLKQVQPGDPPPPCTCGECSECRARYLKFVPEIEPIDDS